jgi:GR25 family glycosyltransferase involved in LPS biosynthesis
MHLICAPGSSSKHMIDNTSVYPKQYHNEREYHSTLLHAESLNLKRINSLASYNLLHLLSTNHKCTHAYFIKTNVAQKIFRSSRRMSPSHLPVKLLLIKTHRRAAIGNTWS